jgi:predicted small integral membrane protein
VTGAEPLAAAVLLVEAAMVAGLGVWMAVAVYDNWVHAALNRAGVAMVMGLEIMARDFPEEFAVVAHRRVTDPRLVDLAFQAIRITETLAAGALLVSALALAGAALGMVAPLAATVLAVLSVAFFCLIWAGFIIGGNYFHYYYCHQWGQSNHFMFMYWGLFVLVLLVV